MIFKIKKNQIFFIYIRFFDAADNPSRP